MITEKSKKQGFTLVETTITITIVILIMIIVYSVYLLSQKVYRQSDIKAELIQNGRVVLDHLVRELRQTRDIITDLPSDNSEPTLIPKEIMFQDGHDISEIKYIRYYLENSDIKKQLIVYYFQEDPNTYVLWNSIDENNDPPSQEILDEKSVGEYFSDIQFYGSKLINITGLLRKDDRQISVSTKVFGRNL